MTTEYSQNEIISMSVVVERLKGAIGIRTDAELARAMSESPKKIAVWKTRNTVPTEKLVRICVDRHLDLQYILTGQKTDAVCPPPPQPTSFPELDVIFEEAGILWKNLDPSERYELASKILKSMASYKSPK